MVKIGFCALVYCVMCPYYIANLLCINKLTRGQGVPGASIVRWGATLKIFFAYFSASASYGFCDFQNMVQNSPVWCI